MFSLCHQAAWWHRAVSKGHVTFLSSCLAGTLVAFGRQAAWRLGAIGMVSSSWLAALCKQCLFVLALVDMFDLTLWLDAARRRRLAMRMCFWRSWAYVARGDFVPFVASRLRLLPVWTCGSKVHKTVVASILVHSVLPTLVVRQCRICADLLEDSHSWAVWSDYGNISGSPSGWSTRSLGDVVLLSALLMAKVPALGILCA